MPRKRENSRDHAGLSVPSKKTEGETPSLTPPKSTDDYTATAAGELKNLNKPNPASIATEQTAAVSHEAAIDAPRIAATPPATAAEAKPTNRKQKKAAKDRDLLTGENWFVRNGHGATYIGLYLFSIIMLFRPYEIVPGLGFLASTAFFFALATLLIYVPSQLAIEGNLTMFSMEVKAILAMTAIALITMPIAKDPGLAWETFNENYSKSVIIFIVLVNVVRTRKRLMGMMWLSFGIGIYLSFAAVDLYLKGEFNVEDYRVKAEIGGMFGNPNEMALHLVMMTPLVITLGIAARSTIMRFGYFAVALMFVAGNMVTFSRGGFLGLLAAFAVLAWKLGRRQRLNVTIISLVVGGLAIVAAPGNYGLRMLSILIPGLDPVGSSGQRSELLTRSIIVSLRNPWGIGIGNFPIVGIRNLTSHNAFTQVSAELGILGLVAYLVFILSPFRKLSAIERTLFNGGGLSVSEGISSEDTETRRRGDTETGRQFEPNRLVAASPCLPVSPSPSLLVSPDPRWFYYLSIGLQASIIGYLVSSFFASVAYNWFIYYLIAYAVAFRRIYAQTEGGHFCPPAETPK